MDGDRAKGSRSDPSIQVLLPNDRRNLSLIYPDNTGGFDMANLVPDTVLCGNFTSDPYPDRS